jgi:glycosyltransferase involved in cell wall biosynthesis
MAEMARALANDVNYEIVGPTAMPSPGNPAMGNDWTRLAYRTAAQIRKNPLGAIAYHHAKTALLLRRARRRRLLHCCSHPAYGDFPWIGDYENANVLAFYSPRLLRSRFFVSHLSRVLSDDSCRAIRVWSERAARSFRELFPEEAIREKIHVIPPAIACPDEALTHRAPNAVPRILFVGRGFWIKGGALFLDAVAQLRKTLDFRVDFVCDLPAECAHYRESLAGIVDFHEPHFTRAQLYSRFYRQADIFVMLGMADSYGVALLEASTFGLPIVAMRLNSGLSDLLNAAGNAFWIEPAYQIFGESGLHKIEPADLLEKLRADRQQAVVQSVAEALAGLIADPAARHNLGERGRAAVLNGPLSIETMREALLKLYRSAQEPGVLNN